MLAILRNKRNKRNERMRMENLLEKKKADQLTPDEVTELETIGELDRIFTHINAMLAAQNANQ